MAVLFREQGIRSSTLARYSGRGQGEGSLPFCRRPSHNTLNFRGEIQARPTAFDVRTCGMIELEGVADPEDFLAAKNRPHPGPLPEYRERENGGPLP
jgi:hypothetical protein